VRDFLTSTVPQGDIEQHPFVIGSCCFQIFCRSQYIVWQSMSLPDDADTDFVRFHAGMIEQMATFLHKQIEQASHLAWRTAEILGTEYENRNIGDTQILTPLQQFFNFIDTILVAFPCIQTNVACKSAIAIQNQADMGRGRACSHSSIQMPFIPPV